MGVYLLVINYLSNNLTVRDASDLRMVGGGGCTQWNYYG